ncbi:NADPH-dependent FMN reductase [Bacillus sp. B1-b2]|uniref:NADPH-dependent FMN reductase n=1 Tax=Bacillus sp. B1-b2 TaxID=2653201 RepID=UPI001261C930|nr:NADPH-dependent FMN reductase [Bacillus sp. B1-b2]KAB7665911.1 NADPH-dependent FMN reductase [Bacillus sp. B1-b2]
MGKVMLIVGAPNNKSRLNGLVDYTIQQLEKDHVSFEIIRVYELPAEDLIHANFLSEIIKDTTKKVQEADGVILYSPVFKATYSGVLKTFLDLLPQKGLENKVVWPLMIGGSFGHLLAIDFGLKPLVSALGADHIIKGVYAVDQEITRLDNNSFTLSDETKVRLLANYRSFYQAIFTKKMQLKGGKKDE